jgi:hypothetical protein
VLGVNVFEKPKISASTASEGVQELFLRAKGIEARGVYTAEGFIVRAGSQAVKAEVPSIPEYLRWLRQSLLKNGVLHDEGNCYLLTQDYTFNSPSAAAGVLLGRSANGRVEWKDVKGQTLKEIQEGAVS